MLKQFGLYGLLCLLLSGMSEQALAMHGAYANAFRIGMQTLHYTGLGSFPYIANKVYHHESMEGVLEKSERLTDESEKYILNTMHTAYPELKNTPINIIKGPLWATCCCNGIHYLLVPCDDDELQKAIAYHKAGAIKRTFNNFLLNLSNTPYKNPQLHTAICEIRGKAMSATTLSAWHISMLHEGSHILHNDSQHSALLKYMIPATVLYGTYKAKTSLGLTVLLKNQPADNVLRGLGYIGSLPLKLIVSCLLLHACRYWHEYRSDQDAIKRSQNPADLHAKSTLFAHLSSTDSSASCQIKHLCNNLHIQPLSETRAQLASLLDPHPTNATRAYYFAKAAQRLEEKQALAHCD